MAFNLTKKEEKSLDGLIADAEKAVSDLEDAKAQLEEDITKLLDDFNDAALAPFNESIGSIRSFVEDIANERRDEYNDKSENWMEGERGTAAGEWIDQWENAVSDLDDLSFLESSIIDIPLEIPSLTNTLEELPRELDV